MKKRPTILWAVGLGLILSPFYYYVAEAYAAQKHLAQFREILGYIHPVKLVAMILGPIVGWATIRVRPSSWYAILGFCLYTIAANFYLQRAYSLSLGKVALFNLSGIICALYFVRREIKSPYFNPRLRWWEVAKRYQIRIGVDVKGRASFSTETYDISESGCFLVTEEPFTLGETVEFSLNFGGDRLELKGKIVWHSEGRGRVPAGIGIKFDWDSRRNFRNFRGVLKSFLKKQSLDFKEGAA